MLNRLFSHSEKKACIRLWPGAVVIAALTGAMALLPGAAAHSYTAPEKQEGKESPVALVNGMPIFPSDLNYVEEAWNFSTRKGARHEDAGTLNQLIVIELLYQESLKHRFHGLAGDAEEIYTREVKRAGSEERLRSTLRCNNISLEQFRRFIFRNLAINRLLDKMVYSRISVSDAEIEEYYRANRHKYRSPESVRLRQIFIKAPRTTDERRLNEVENRARNIFRQATDGSDFVALARKYSDDPAGARIGGEMGIIYKGNLHHTFESLVFNHSEGSVTEPIRTYNGYYIFQVVSLSPSVPKPLEEVRSRVITEIRRSRARSMISQYISSLREKADIRILQEDHGH